MASLGQILRRFRFHGVPGAPAAFAVPADRAAELEKELQPVLSLLDATQRRAAVLVRRAEREADRQRASGLEQARGVVTEARTRARSARAETSAALLSRSATEHMTLLNNAKLEVDRIERLAAERRPALVKRVVGRALSIGTLAQ